MIIHATFPQAPAVRTLSNARPAALYDFCAYKAARMVSDDDLFAVASAIERRVMELRKMIESQTGAFEGVARDE